MAVTYTNPIVSNGTLMNCKPASGSTFQLGTNTVLGVAPERILEIPDLLSDAPKAGPIPLWDGHAGRRAADVIAEFVGAGSPLYTS